MIGTHNSVTAEKGHGFWKFFRFFGQTQRLTITEQSRSGVQYFDLRVRRTKRGWICAHGLWETKKTFAQILKEISLETPHPKVLVAVTYEGTFPGDLDEEKFKRFIKKCLKKYPNLTLYSVSEKYSGPNKEWKTYWTRPGYTVISHYPHFSITPFPPIPSLWKMEKPENPQEDENTILIIDFYDKELSK